MGTITKHIELNVYKLSFESAVEIYQISKEFPSEERYSLIDQIRRSSRSVSANIAEAWRKRKYPKSFIAKLSDSESEAAETQVWLDFCLSFGYIDKQKHKELYDKYEHIIAMLIIMSTNSQKWALS